jgi:hypothetical protein
MREPTTFPGPHAAQALGAAGHDRGDDMSLQGEDMCRYGSLKENMK